MPFYGYSSFDLFYLPSFVGTECNSALTIMDISAIGYLYLKKKCRLKGIYTCLEAR